MNTDFEAVMAAQFEHLQAAAVLAFSADAAASSAVLTGVSNFKGLFLGLPVFGPGVPRGASILELDEDAATITLTAPVTAAVSGGAFKTGFLNADRRVKHWQDVAEQPALFLRKIGTTDAADGHFVITTLECEVWIYSNAGKNPKASPDIMLGLLDQLVRQSFAPDGDYGDPRFTLGGMVFWSRIEGRADYSPGDQQGQAIARIPVRITLP